MCCLMIDPSVIEAIRKKYDRLSPIMDERMRRQWAACEALALPRGGIAAVAEATGLSRTTIWAAVREIRERDNLVLEDEGPLAEYPERTRRPGGGRPSLAESDP